MVEYKVEGLNELSKQFNEFSRRFGFGNVNLHTRMLLIHSEVSEAFEALRKDKMANPVQFRQDSARHSSHEFLDMKDFENNIKDSLEDELADAVIRLLELCAFLDIDIEFFIKEKMKYNEQRGYKFGGKPY